MLAVALTLSLLAQDVAQAPDGPLGLIGGNRDVSMWTSEPVEISPGVWSVWWRTFMYGAGMSDGMDRAASRFEVHCADNRLRQARHELYAGDRLLSGYDQSQPLHDPVDRWADPQVLARVCGGSIPQVNVPNAAAAAMHFRR